MTPLRILYLLEDTHLAGGIRVAVAQADELIRRGHHVVLATKGEPLTWRHSRARWEYVDSWDEIRARDYDFVIGTFWKTIEHAYLLAAERTIHLCQGYEGSFTVYQPLVPEIEHAYRLPIPKITVSPHLVELCRTFHHDATWVGQIVDDVFFREPKRRARARRVLLVGPAQADFKGIDIGYDAVRHARSLGAGLELIRASQWPAAEGEPVQLADEFHIGLDSREMARLIASCDIALGPSRQQEGFGLPVAEAMAAGLPVALSAIPSFLSFDRAHNYALFAPEEDGPALGEQLARLVQDGELRAEIGARGKEVAEQFRAEHTGRRLEEYFLGRRRSE
ncbi:MAG TPA: glycosyltransferase family 4 protein [Thermoanaerobaculia bacterium]|jgi:glycosyltransferase involved in cell wall biosynthesis|nr:glycosyltransferase family 4 protein [Thermoanaerobaculia bacterium]